MNSLFCFAFVCSFALLIKLSLSQPTIFLTFTLLSHSPILMGAAELLAMAKP